MIYIVNFHWLKFLVQANVRTDIRTSSAEVLTDLKSLKDPTYAIFLKSWGFKDVKYVSVPFNSAPALTAMTGKKTGTAEATGTPQVADLYQEIFGHYFLRFYQFLGRCERC